MKKERIVLGVDLQRVREAANLTRAELATRLGKGGYKAGNVTLYETESRYVGLTMLKQWARACGHHFRIVLEPNPRTPPKPARAPLPSGWFSGPDTIKRHYDPGTGQSVCGSFYSKGASLEEHTHDQPDNCQRCARCRRLLGTASSVTGPAGTPS